MDTKENKDFSNIYNIESFFEDIDNSKEKNITIQGENSYYKESFYTTIIYNEKEYKNFIKNVEKIVRKSDEYNYYIGYLKNIIELHNCAILGNVDDIDATIEFHHYPFTLYDIVSIVLEKKLDRGEPVSTFTMANEIMNLHFNHNVGLVPLSKTAHELAHLGEIFINVNQVFGNIGKFVKDYDQYIEKEYKIKFNELLELSKKNTSYSGNDVFAINEE